MPGLPSGASAFGEVESMDTSTAGPTPVPLELRVNGETHRLMIQPRVSLLDALRDRLGLYGTKKGCNQGACGACTVLADGHRVLSCLSLALAYQGRDIVTVEGLSEHGELHPMQKAFVEHDGFQCGYCTPGQLCSSLGMLREFQDGVPSAVTADVASGAPALTDEELRERMSGNLCRCSAYNGICQAIQEGARAMQSQEVAR